MLERQAERCAELEIELAAAKHFSLYLQEDVLGDLRIDHDDLRESEKRTWKKYEAAKDENAALKAAARALLSVHDTGLPLSSVRKALEELL